jgi:hypothetical protein
MEYDPFEKVTDEKISGYVDLVILFIADPLASEFNKPSRKLNFCRQSFSNHLSIICSKNNSDFGPTYPKTSQNASYNAHSYSASDSTTAGNSSAN